MLILPAALIWLGSACYSVEFKPDSDYPNLRRPGVGRVEIRRSPPERPYGRLGVLVVRDYSGDLNSENFQTRIRREARSRGASGAWILGVQVTEQTAFEGSTVPTGRGAARDRHPTGSLRSRVGVVRVLLFNYAPGERPMSGEAKRPVPQR